MFLDAFSEGLEVFYLKSAIEAFPDLFEQLFVASDTCSPNDVLSILQFRDDLAANPEQLRVAGFLKSVIRKLDETGKVVPALKSLARGSWAHAIHSFWLNGF